MTERKTALAIGAHPDDVEFMMAGTLTLLKEAGYEPHILTVANGSCGTAEHSRENIIALRRVEAENAARVIGAVYHPGLVDDIMIYYEDKLLRQVTAIVREVKPEIVLVPSPNDYMEDHQNTSRLAVSACFCRIMRNFISDPPMEPIGNDVYLYHANPWGNRDGLRHVVVPDEFVDVSEVIGTKVEMLRCHATQKNWLDVSQGLDSYIITMKDICRDMARMSGADFEYAEGFRRHLHGGLSAKDVDRLQEVLGDKVVALDRQ